MKLCEKAPKVNICVFSVGVPAPEEFHSKYCMNYVYEWVEHMQANFGENLP